MRRIIVTFGLFMLLAIPAGVAAQARPVFCEGFDPYPAGGCSVIIGENKYGPDSARVPVGTTVTWSNYGWQPHTVEDEYLRFSSGTIAPGGAFSHTFSEPGYFTYSCTFHPEMRGEVIVME